MKKISKKLNLNRETLLPLNNDELEGVNGGVSPTVPLITASIATASMVACSWVGRRLSVAQ